MWPEGDTVPLQISRVEAGGRGTVLHFDGIETRNAAEALAGRYLEAEPHELPDGAYYWSDLIGLNVEEPDGTEVGRLAEIFRSGGNEVYRIEGANGERLIPALRSVVLRIDLAAGLMVVAPDDSEEIG